MRATNLIEFIKEMLNFCMKRLDTFAELLKVSQNLIALVNSLLIFAISDQDQAAKLVCTYTSEADDG